MSRCSVSVHNQLARGHARPFKSLYLNFLRPRIEKPRAQCEEVGGQELFNQRVVLEVATL